MLAAANAQPHKTHNLIRKEALDAADPRPFNKALRYLSTTFGVAAPRVLPAPGRRGAR